VYVSHGDDDVREYKSVEHAFQALKTLDMLEREAIRSARSPSEAKAMGRTVKLRPDWDDKKIGFMRMLVRQKFSTNPLRSELMATGEAELIDGNYWHDTFWGMCGGVGTNHLGKILMEVRREIADEQKATPVSQVTGKLTMDDV
jgi:ribA/ribD-fused uncharacterized protein